MLERAAARGDQQRRDHALPEHFQHQRQSRWPAPPRRRYICCSRVTGRLHRCGPRCTRTATPIAPFSRDIPWPTLSFSNVGSDFVHRARFEQGALESRRLAAAALLVPQGVAQTLVLAPRRQRCAALAMRARGCLSAAQRVLLRTSQDRRRFVFGLWQQSRRLRTSRPRVLHEGVRLVNVV